MPAVDPDTIACLPPNESCLVYAGPGTGKTQLLVKRLNFLLRNPARPGAGIACITYTNAAADEIAGRLQQGAKPEFLGTIHSFLLEYVVYPYGYWLDRVPADFDLVTEGYARPHLQWMQATNLISRSKAHVPDVVAAFEMIGYDVDGNLKGFGRTGLTEKEMRAFVDRRLAEKQISQQDVLWFAWRILSNPNWQHVLEALSCRFAAILVDEFQDTTEIQYAVLKKLHEKGRSALLLVGDAEQSIFSFAGASENSYINAAKHFPSHALSINHRSTKKIVHFLDTFLSPDKQITAEAKWKDLKVPVYILVGEVDDRDRILEFMELRKQHHLTGGGRNPEYLILARGAERARRLSGMSREKSEVLEDMFYELEGKHPQLNAILKDLFRARKLIDLGEHGRAFRSLDRGLSRLILKANPGFGSPEIVGLIKNSWRIMVCTVLREMKQLDDKDVREWVTNLAEKIKEAIIRAGGNKTGKKLVLLGKLQENLKKRTEYRTEDALRLVDVPDEVTSSVRTIHRAKGLEAEAVLVLASTGGQFTEWMNPFGNKKPRTENARIGYVGFSRAMKMLCIATPSASPETRNILSKCSSVEVLELGKTKEEVHATIEEQRHAAASRKKRHFAPSVD